jgi:uncharacterized membrane protein
VPATSRQSALKHLVHFVLLWGVLLSGALLLLGLAFSLAQGHPWPEPKPPRLSSLVDRALRGDGTALVDLGVLVLLGTPALRVAVLMVGWRLGGSRRFAVVACVVLALLSLSVWLGAG